MKRVTGLGGVFFKNRDHEAVQSWYHQHLGIDSSPYGCHSFLWKDANSEEMGYTVWSPFKGDTEYFGSGDQQFMVNYRVDDLEQLLKVLAEEGVEIAAPMEQHENGKFGWIVDPEGRRIELWEPVPADKDPYLPK